MPGRFITSARIQSNGNSASALQASQPEISLAVPGGNVGRHGQEFAEKKIRVEHWWSLS
jgi:hypothetical protein